MPRHALRKILSLQSLLIISIPFAVVTIIAVSWLLPHFKNDIEHRQINVATELAGKIHNHLATAASIAAVSAKISNNGDLSCNSFLNLLQAQLDATNTISTIYAADTHGKVTAVALSVKNRQLQQELMQIDLSRNQIFQTALNKQALAWSDTFLSSIGGGISVAVAAPSAHMVVIAEVQLAELSVFLKQISNAGSMQVLVIDNRGQIIADQDGRFTAQQLNISNIPFIRDALTKRQAHAGHFTFGNREMIGSAVNIPSVNWVVLAAQPTEDAYRATKTTAGIAIAIFLLSTVSGILLSMRMAGNMAARFGNLAENARRIGSLQQAENWVESDILEIQQLSDSLQDMGRSLKKREQDLLKAKEYAENLINVANIIIVGLDTAGNVTLMNHRAEELTGYALPEIEGKNGLELLLSDEVKKEVCKELEKVRGNAISGNYENQIITKQGEKKTISWHNSPLYENGNITGTISFGIDVTEQRMLEAKLQQAQKLESIGRLAGGVAHDFNNKLTVILGYAEIMKMRFDAADRNYHDLNEIIKAAEHSRDITAQLLAFSRKQNIVPRVININAKIAETAKTLPRLIGEDILLITELADELWFTCIDPTQLDQIIMNLSVNARDAMDKGGVLKIVTENVVIDEERCKKYLDATPGRYVMLAFSDNGCGMDEATQQHIFEPFYTTKPVGKGTGLGLATIYGIVTQNKGFIDLDSRKNEGTTFRIYLPYIELDDIAEHTAEATNVKGTGTVLLVEDEPSVRSITYAMLQELGYQVFEAGTPQQAIEICQSGRQIIDIIVTDVVMPGMDGKQMIDTILVTRPDMKVLFISGYTSETISLRGIPKGHVHFLPKPFNIHTLNNAIRDAMSAR